jgi:hypothetical protein
MPEDIKTSKRMVVEEVATPTDIVHPPAEPLEETAPAETAAAPVVETKPEVTAKPEPVVESEPPKVEEKPAEEAKVVSEVESTKPETVVKSTNGTNPLIIIIPGVLLLGALLGGIVFYQRGISSEETIVSTPTPNYENTTASPSPSATAGAVLDLSKYPINVKNGSGISGQASVVKDLLVTAGFTVSGTGNAESYDFTKTVIKAKADVPDAFLTQLSTALSKNYVLDANQSLATSSSNIVEVIVGSTKAE